MNTSDASSEDEIMQSDDWRDEHGQPDFEYLQTLADNGSPEALERMRTIAEDLDAEYDADSSFEDLIQSIRSAAERNAGGGDAGITS